MGDGELAQMRARYIPKRLWGETLLLKEEVAEILRIKPEGVKTLIRRGDLPVQPVGPRHHRIAQADLLEYLVKQFKTQSGRTQRLQSLDSSVPWFARPDVRTIG